ncbi:Orotidine 5'-phosphate decarboxylase [Leifsonia rubra CMS 76R]|nr:Orotidine 5'-phosphate decarboxylase [Leifsonia rubra CMS 76R]
MPSFATRLSATFEEFGGVCLGIDPHPFLLETWGLSNDVHGIREFALRTVDAAAGNVGMIKPQVAFFERFGSAGYAVLEESFALARSAGLLVIADVKRGDLSSSVDAYGQAWLTPGSALEADAMTAVAYQGVSELSGPVELARTAGKGIFVLAATSNLAARSIQTARVVEGEHDGSTVAASVVHDVRALNSESGLGSFGVVIGATVNVADYGLLAEDLIDVPVLAPGFGAQGAQVEQARELYGAAVANTIVTVSRSVLQEGSSQIPLELRSLRSQLREQVR